MTKKELIRAVGIKRIAAAKTPKERAALVERVRRALQFVEHRALKQRLKTHQRVTGHSWWALALAIGATLLILKAKNGGGGGGAA